MNPELLARFSGAGTPFDFPEAIGYSRSPFASTPAGSWQAVAGPNGVAIGAFGWFDTGTGQVGNVYAAGMLLVFVLPLWNPYNAWQRAYVEQPVYGDIFNGLAVTTASSNQLTITQTIRGYIRLGSPLAGANIPVGTIVADLGSYTWQTGGTLTMSAAATASAGPQTVTATPPANACPFAQMIVRPGVECVTAVQGVFAPKFPLGGQVGTQVYADPATGLPYSGSAAGLMPTPYTLMQSGVPGARLRMSSFVSPLIN